MTTTRWGTRALTAVTGLVLLAVTGCGGGESRRETEQTGQQGVTATEIKVGGSFPFSGPFAAFADADKGISAYFASVNAAGGINGRKIVYTSADDGYDPSRLAANARKSVEQDQVAAFLSFGGPNISIQPYMNTAKVPQIVLAGNQEFGRSTEFPYSHAWWPDLSWEAELTTRYVLDNPADFPSPQFGLISLNNTLAASHAGGTAKALGDRAATLFPPANQIRVEPAATDLSSQVNQLRAAGVNVLYMNPGNAGMINAMKYIKQIGWPVKVFLYSASAGYTQVLVPAGLDTATGYYSTQWLKDPADPRWADDAGMRAYREVITQHGNGAKPEQFLTANGYGAAQALVTALKSVKGDITGDAINTAWNAIQAQPSDVLFGKQLDAGPGGRLVYSYQPIRFDGRSWRDVGPLVDVRARGIAV